MECHGNVAAERCLNFHGDLRRNERARSIDVILKFDTVLCDLTQLRQRENLVPAAIGQDRPIPIHEIMQTPNMFDHVESRTEDWSVRVARNVLRVTWEQF